MMKKIKILVLALGILSTLSVYSQEEFFGNNTGLSASYSQNFNFGKIESSDEILRDGQLSLYLKNGFIFTGDYSNNINYDFYGASIGYLINNKDNNKLKYLFDLSYGELINEYKITSINIGLMKVLLSNSNFPFSISASTSLNLFFYDKSYYYFQPTATIGYSQSFFANNQIYPIIGVGKTFLVFNNSIKYEDFIFHIGLNIKLSQSDTMKEKKYFIK